MLLKLLKLLQILHSKTSLTIVKCLVGEMFVIFVEQVQLMHESHCRIEQLDIAYWLLQQLRHKSKIFETSIQQTTIINDDNHHQKSRTSLQYALALLFEYLSKSQ